MNLIIVESPVKSKTLQSFLGKKYLVQSSYGHIRDLPKGNLGVDTENDFEPKYVIPTKSRKVINLLKSEAQKSQLTILATDEDREGEAIAWHLSQVLNLNGKKPYQRIVFHEITERAIKEALKKPRKINMKLVNAQQARRILDRLVGYKLSPFLWKKVARGLSAGRVQSIAVRLVAEREREIQKFTPQEYWQIIAKFKKMIEAILIKKDGKTIPKLEIKTKKEADKIVKDLKGAEVDETSSYLQAALPSEACVYKVINIEKKEIKRNPLPPFTTSTLQQTAWQKFKFPAKLTMGIAQQLYERGLCVDENSLVITRKGEIYRIKDLENSSEALIGINEATLKPEIARIKKLWKIKAPSKIITIETDDHEKLSITPDHPLMIMRNGYPTWVKGESIKKGDYIAALETIPVVRRKIPSHLIELIQCFPKSIQERIIFKFSPQFSPFIRRKKKKESIPYHVIERLWKEKRVPIKKIERYYRGIRIKPDVGNSKFHKIPFYFSKKLAYLLGFAIGDGHLPSLEPKIRLAIKSKSLFILDNLNKLVGEILGEEFNRFDTKKSQALINSTFLYHLFQQLGCPSGNKCSRIDIPNILLSQPDETLGAYIAGLWDSDGCINKHPNPTANSIQVSYSSKSELFIDKLRLLLKTFGINSSKHLDKRTKVFWLRLTTNGIPKFKEQIAPYLIIKKERWEKFYQKYHHLYENRVISQCQKIPEINSLLKNLLNEKGLPKQKLSKLVDIDLFNYFGKVDSTHTRLPFIQKPVLEKIATFIDTKEQLFRRLSTSPIIWKKITKVKSTNYKKPYVYDVTTSTNTFIANGIISHNCTYHRTDSLNLSDLSLFSAKKFIIKNYGEKYWPGFLRKYKTKTKGAQEAHEAIRPAYPDKTPSAFAKASADKDKLDNNQIKLYDLIWRRFIACQMSQAIFNSTVVDISAKNYIFRTSGQVLKFDGFLKVYPLKYEENELPALEINEILELIKLLPSQHFTQPLPRYNEATLIKALEENGIGRPSTYAPILSNIQEKNYIEKDEQRRFRPTEIGLVVNDLLKAHFPEIVDIGFTAKMEENLDKIAAGQKKWTGIVKDFYQPFEKNLKQKYEEVSKKDITEKPTEKTCPKCQAPLLIRLGKYGKFYACSRFPKCRYTESLEENVLGIKCPKCKKGEIVEKRTKKRKIFYGCNQFPKCDFALWDKPTGEKCPKCGSLLIKTKRAQIKCSSKECDYKVEK